MEILKSPKAIAMVTTALFVGSLFWLANTRRVNVLLETDLKEQSLKAESLLSEKLLLQKEIDRFKDQLFSMKDQNRELTALSEKATAQLKRQEADFNRMKKENMSLTQVRKQRLELTALKSQLENELQLLKASYADLQNQNQELNTTVAALQERNRILTEDLGRAMFAAVDYSRVEANKGKSDRLTVKAKRTRKLIANFEVPANFKNLRFRIVNDKGVALTEQDGLYSTSITPSEKTFIASADTEIEGQKLQNVELVYVPKAKLKPGVYTIEILNENLYVESLKVRLK